MDANKDEIQVLMMGARRAGKTSTLSGLLSMLNSNELREYLSIQELTTSHDSISSLSGKIKKLESVLRDSLGKTILMDEGSTSSFIDYTIQVNIPDNGGSLKITFTDSNGEFYANGNIHAESVKEKIAHYDIIVIAIDTPFLMEMYNPNNKLCTQSVGQAYNQIDNVHNLLCSIDDDNGKNAKLVFFSPIKCELWANRGELDKVSECVKKAYETPIRALCAFSNIEVVILPIITIGGLEFEAHRKALTLSNSVLGNVNCSPIGDNGLLLSNGSTYAISQGDTVQPDPKALIEGFNITRPNSWFKVVSSHYSPRNCEQLAYYILQFALIKSLKLKKQVEEERNDRRWWQVPLAVVLIASGVGAWGAGLLAYHFIAKRLGSVKTEKLQATINKLKKNGLFKVDVDGIVILNKGVVSDN